MRDFIYCFSISFSAASFEYNVAVYGPRHTLYRRGGGWSSSDAWRPIKSKCLTCNWHLFGLSLWLTEWKGLLEYDRWLFYFFGWLSEFHSQSITKWIDGPDYSDMFSFILRLLLYWFPSVFSSVFFLFFLVIASTTYIQCTLHHVHSVHVQRVSARLVKARVDTVDMHS